MNYPMRSTLEVHMKLMPGSVANILDAVGNTPLVKLNKIGTHTQAEIYVKCEYLNPGGSMKDRIAINMIDDAEERGLIHPGGTIVEATSGNTGMGLALVAAVRGYKTIFIMPDKMSMEKIMALRAVGAKVVVTPTDVEPEDPRSYYSVSRRIAEETPNAFYANQYHNLDNTEAHYKSTGPEIWTQTGGEIDVFVAGLGTGGTLMGVGRRLKEHNLQVKVVAVAPEPDDLISGLRRLEDGFIPPILDLNMLDARILVSSFDAFSTTKSLLEKEGIFAGVSSGSVVSAALRQAERMDQGTIVCLLADGGWKYLSTGLWTKDYEQLAKEAQGKIWW